MDMTIERVHVTNWSGDPFLKLGSTSKAKLATAIRYSRQIVDDACQLLAQYEHAQIVASVDKQMATDYFGSHSVFKEALEKYFGLDLKKPTDKAKVATIRLKFGQIRTGISGPFDLVVGYIHDRDDVKTGVKDALSALRHGKGKTAWKHIKFIREGTEGWVASRGTHVGRIHLNMDSVETYSEGKIARIIVHEASHKFANTDDVDVLDDGTRNGSGYKWDDLKYDAKGYVGLENNADSYAWGGRLMWKRKRNLASGV